MAAEAAKAAAEAKLREAEEAKAAAEAEGAAATEAAKAKAAKDDAETRLREAIAARDTAEAAKGAAEARLSAAQAAWGTAEAAKMAAEAAKDAAKAKLSAAEAARDDAIAARNVAEAAKSAAETKLSAAEDAKKDAEAAKSAAEAAKDAADAKLHQAEDVANVKLSVVEAKLRETEQKLLEAKEAANAETEAKLSEVRGELENKLREAKDARDAAEALETMLREAEGAKTAAEADKTATDSQLAEAIAKLSAAEGALQKTKSMMKDIEALNQANNNLTFLNGQIEEENKMNEAQAAANRKSIIDLEHRLSGLNNQIAAKGETIRQAKSLLTAAVSNMKQLIKENEILRGNTGGFVLQESPALQRYDDELIRFDENDVKEINIRTFNTEADQLWLFGDNDHKMFKNDESNFQLIEFNELSLEINKFRLKPYLKYQDPHYVIFRAYLYNKLIRKLNDFLKNQGLGQLQFETIVKFNWTSVEGQLSSIGSQPISVFKSTDFFKSWKKPEAKKFNDEDEKFLKFLEQPKNRREKIQIVKGDKKIAYQDLRKLFIDKVFCPVFHSAQYIKRTYPTITSFVEFIDKNDKKGNINFKSEDVIDKAIMKDMKIGPDDQNSTTVVHVKFKNGTDFRPKPTTGGKKSRVPKFMKFDNPMSGGSRYVNFKLSSRSIERVQNVSYYNIVKTIRWRYYLSRKKTEEPVEVTVFKDYLFTLIACVFLLAAGNDKLAYGTFVDQLLSIGLLYEFDQDFAALLLPYYLPFT